MTQNILY